MHTPSPLDDREQTARLRAFLRWSSALATVFGLLELVVGQLVDHPQVLWTGVAILTYPAVAAFASWRLRRQLLSEAAFVISMGVLVCVVLIAIVQPYSQATLVVLTLVAGAIALQYLHGRALGISLAASWFAAAAIVTLATLRPIPPTIPVWLLSALNVLGVIIGAGLALILLWQSRRRLANAILDARRANEALRLAQAEGLLTERRLAAAERNESLGILAGGIAHDFNNLLTTIMGHADLLRHDLAADGPRSVDESLTAIQVAARHAADLARQMLAYSGRTAVTLRRLDPGDAVRSIVDELRPTVPVGIALGIAVVGAPPPLDADRDQLRQAIDNLVRNAVEAISGDRPSGEATGRITVTVAQRVIDDPSGLGPGLAAGQPIIPGRYVTIGVADDGPGVDPAIVGRMFEPFATSHFQGRGLGLSVVLGMARSHGGSVIVGSEPGHGTTATILLPASV